MTIAGAAVIVQLVGCIILIPHYGANGAAFGTLLSSAVCGISALAVTYKIFNFKIDFVSIVKAVVVCALVFAVGWFAVLPVILLPLLYVGLGLVYVMALHTMGEITL
jgi:O-antigen/teichoic acid export membrane protein